MIQAVERNRRRTVRIEKEIKPSGKMEYPFQEQSPLLQELSSLLRLRMGTDLKAVSKHSMVLEIDWPVRLVLSPRQLLENILLYFYGRVTF
jgi:hypothetical protein